MEIVIRGHPKKVSKAIMRKAADHYAGLLMSHRLHENIHCTISFKKPEKDCYGSCLAYYEKCDGRPRIFDIDLNDGMSRRRTLETLAHEMVHLKQYATTEWYEFDRTPNRHRWKGEIIDLDKENNEYWLAPWEVEAYGSEFGLYRSFIKAHKDLL